jgi:hypothetical protein
MTKFVAEILQTTEGKPFATISRLNPVNSKRRPAVFEHTSEMLKRKECLIQFD